MSPTPAVAGTRTINLWATSGRISTPDGHSIYIWGFADGPDKGARLPGPTIVARQGETLIINLTNELTEPVSLFFHGQEGVQVQQGPNLLPVQPQYDTGGKLIAFTNVAGHPGNTDGMPTSISYVFTATKPGTYLYESGADVRKQVPMGLYGALVVLPSDYDAATPGYKTAYGWGTGTDYDREYLLIVSEIDPDLNDAVEQGRPYDVRAYKPRYWTINGRMAPDTMFPHNVPYLPNQPYGSMVMLEPGEKVLLRYVGAGVESHPLHPHGNHTRLVALDGRLLRNGTQDLSYRRFTVLVGPGQTYDQIYTWTGLGYSSSNPIPTVIPNIQNLDVGDAGWTMYSGSPYLGVKGDIPVGITSFNKMGEYYFMLHSHEEMQITNWGEFPGGMMTMIAVFPPGTLAPDIGVLP